MLTFNIRFSMKRTIIPYLFFLLPLLMVSIGCNRGPAKPEGFPPLFPCTLTFEQEGSPLSGAVFSLLSVDDPSFKWSVGGITDEAGKAVLTTNGLHRGAPAGKYKITVRKMVVLARTEETLKRADVIDPLLQKAETTTLEIEIAKGDNEKTLEVGKAVSVPIIED